MPHVVLDQLKGFPVPSTSLSNPYDDRPAKIYFCRAEELPTHFKMHSFGVEGSPSTVLTGAAVDEIMKTGGRKTESTAYYTVGATRSGQVGSKFKCGQSYADDSELPLAPRVREMIEAMLSKFG